MARKKQEIALQVEIETQEEWEEMLAKEGLTVVDVYQEWCGPCTAMLSNFKRLKNELGDDLLHFAVAKADTVDCLEKYRGKCEPNFLFFAGGVLVAVIRGSHSPRILKTITEQLAYEHKVLEGNVERKEIRDPFLSDLDDRQKTVTGDEDDEDEEETNKGITVAIIKPDLVAAGKVDEIKQKMSEAGIEILEATDRTLTEEEAREFYKHKQDEEFFEDLVKFMSSGPSHVLVLTKGDTGDTIIDEWRDLLGPAQVEKAKEEAPESLRAQYGTENYVNALHGSDSNETAMGELAFFFPSFSVPKVQKPGAKPKIQRTLALIRPEAMAERKDEILQKIQESGFTIAMQKEIRLSKEQAEEFYKEHQGQEYFDTLTTKMSSGPLLALALAREDAVTGWRDMLGPKEVPEAKEKQPQSLRAQFSQDDDVINPLHGSDSASNAEKELDYFFPMQQTVAVVKPDAYQTKEEIMAKIKEAGFNIAARKETEISKEVAEQFYKDVNDKEYYGDLIEHMTSGPSLFMVLSREDAVDGWRSIIGPTDPAQAKEQNPDSLRAQFGTDAKANAVHGSSNPESAKESIKLVFGDMEFNKDGGDNQREPTRENTQAEGESQQEQTEQTTQDGGEEQNKDDTAEADESEQQQQQGEGQAETREGGDQTTQDDRPPSAKSQTAQEEKSASPVQKDDTTVSKENTTVSGDNTQTETNADDTKEGDRPASSKSQAQAAEGDRPATAKSQTQADRPASAKSQTQASRPATAKSQTQAADETQSVQKENTTVSKENTAVSKENTTVSKENTTVSGDNKQEADDTKADDQNKTDDTKEGEQQADETKPSTPPADDQKASEEQAADDQKPAEDDQKPAEDDQKPAENDQKPAEDDQKPAEEGQASTEGGDKKEDEAPKKEGDQQQEQT